MTNKYFNSWVSFCFWLSSGFAGARVAQCSVRQLRWRWCARPVPWIRGLNGCQLDGILTLLSNWIRSRVGVTVSRSSVADWRGWLSWTARYNILSAEIQVQDMTTYDRASLGHPHNHYVSSGGGFITTSCWSTYLLPRPSQDRIGASDVRSSVSWLSPPVNTSPVLRMYAATYSLSTKLVHRVTHLYMSHLKLYYYFHSLSKDTLPHVQQSSFC